MGNSQSIEVTFPVGRIVQGSLYAPQEKDMQGNPLTIKSGPNKGQPTKKWFFAVAFAKTKPHWGSEDWGAAIWAYGHQSWPSLIDRATGLLPASFAWKIEDGDSTTPNKNGRKNSEREGFPGHWVVNFSSSFAPKIFTSTGDPILEPNAVKVGYFVVVRGSVQSNENTTNPGNYVNHGMVGFVGYGPEIHQGPNPKDIFKGGYALPPGASSAPVGGAALPAAAATPGGSPPPPPPAGSPPPPGAPAPGVAQVPVVPNPGFVGAPGAAAPPPPPPAAAAPPPPVSGPQMTAAANGVTYAQFIAGGWTDAQLRAKGMMI
jgi:hypothetical protein